MNSSFSLSGKSRHCCPIIFPTSHSFKSELDTLIESQTFREYRIYGINGFSGAFGGLMILASAVAADFPNFCGVKAGLPWALCMNGLELSCLRLSELEPEGRNRCVVGVDTGTCCL